MRTRIGLIVSAGLAVVLFVSSLSEAQRRSVNTQINTNNRLVTDCSQVDIRFNREDAVRAEDVITIGRNQIQFLQIQPTRNGGVHVSGWDGNDYVVKTCKAAPRDAPGVLGQITTANVAGRVTVSGPQGDDWVAFLIVQAPRNGALDLETVNGPISFRDVSGRVRARATNGPITLENVSGEVEVSTSNGPIKLAGGSGSQRLNASNGPVNVTLTGNRWDGAGLEVTTQNGPLTLNLPDPYLSGVRVDVSEHSPVRCLASQCSQAQRSWSNPTRIEFGGPPVVRLSTVNGPVRIEGTR